MKLPSPFSRNTLIPCSEKTSWSLKTSFGKKNCPTNTKTVMNIFQAKRFPWSLTLKKFFIIFFEFIGQFCFPNDVFKLQEVFSEQGIRVFLENLENGLVKFPDIFYFTDFRQTSGAKKIPKTVLKTKLKPRETTYTLVFLSEAFQLGYFQCFWKIYWGLSQKLEVLGKIQVPCRNQQLKFNKKWLSSQKKRLGLCCKNDIFFLHSLTKNTTFLQQKVIFKFKIIFLKCFCPIFVVENKNNVAKLENGSQIQDGLQEHMKRHASTRNFHEF
jgi:hypothetical protein